MFFSKGMPFVVTQLHGVPASHGPVMVETVLREVAIPFGGLSLLVACSGWGVASTVSAEQGGGCLLAVTNSDRPTTFIPSDHGTASLRSAKPCLRSAKPCLRSAKSCPRSASQGLPSRLTAFFEQAHNIQSVPRGRQFDDGYTRSPSGASRGRNSQIF
ncbi:MAG: hypothetical protein H7839_20575 [Magnetococcus sp. YQC-5]